MRIENKTNTKWSNYTYLINLNSILDYISLPHSDYYINFNVNVAAHTKQKEKKSGYRFSLINYSFDSHDLWARKERSKEFFFHKYGASVSVLTSQLQMEYRFGLVHGFTVVGINGKKKKYSPWTNEYFIEQLKGVKRKSTTKTKNLLNLNLIFAFHSEINFYSI